MSSVLNPESYAEILDNIPHLVMRLTFTDPAWNVSYLNKAIERYGYTREDFLNGKMTWNDMVHPDDIVVALKLSRDYMKREISDFKLQYRIITKGGASIYITEYSHVNRGKGGQVTIDSFLFENLEAQSAGGEEAVRRNLALNDILLTIQDAKDAPGNAIQFILDRIGALLDCSRALLFRDSPDHKTCKVEYEWCNHGITSVKDLDYAVTYSTEMPEIYVALQDTGVLLVNAGEIPENCKEEFEAEGLTSSAIFAVYQYGDHYGFVCFDDCIIERRWDDDTANFLKVVANLFSNVVMSLQSERYMHEYEEKIKQLAFRDYQTALPNHYPFDSDSADLTLAASEAKSPAYGVVIVLGDNIARSYGIRKANDIGKEVAARLQELLAATLGERAVLYRTETMVFAALVQPGAIEPVREFAEKAAAMGQKPWLVGDTEYRCALDVAASPFGVRIVDPEKIGNRFESALVNNPGKPLVFMETED